MRFFLGLGLLGLSSCLTLGQRELPDAALKTPLVHCAQSLEDAALDKTALVFKVKQQPAKVLSTAKSAWDTHLRYVYPYGKNTLQFEVSVENKSKVIFEVDDNVVLTHADQSMQALPQSFFERLWPESAVQTESQLHDRSMAMGEVLQHRWYARSLYPGESYTGLVIFKAPDKMPPESTLSFSVRTADSTQEQTQNICLKPSIAPVSE